MRTQYLKNRITARLISMLAILAGVLLFSTTTFASVDKLNISQIIQAGNDVYLYVSALDNSGKSVNEASSAEQFSVNIDKKETLAVDEAVVSGSLEEGVSYTFCIDISKSVTEEEMEQIRNSISEFLGRMTPNDYARIITIGTEITAICETTQNQSELSAAVQNIQRTASYTYLYEGLSFALDGQRKRIDTIPDRAAVIVFTDGMDDSDGASSEEQVLVDIAETRIPVYVVGLKGNDSEAKLNSVGQIARQSGGRILSYNDMSVSEAVQLIQETVQNTYKLHVKPNADSFGKQNLVWNVSCTLNGYAVTSTNYVYSLGLEGVETEPATEEQTELKTEKETEPETQIMTEPETEPEKSMSEKVSDFIKENLIICIASGVILLALIILIVCLLQKKKKENDHIETESYDSFDMDSAVNSYGEETLAETDFEDEETIAGHDDGFDDEETVAGYDDKGIKLEFEITFHGQTETERRTLTDQLVLGRGNDCDIDVVLRSTSEDRKETSRRHAFILDRPDGVYVVDNSKNKTYLNGVEISEETALRDEDILQMGKASVKVKILG